MKNNYIKENYNFFQRKKYRAMMRPQQPHCKNVNIYIVECTKAMANTTVLNKPGWAPSSITCSFDVICPALELFVAKEMRIEGFSFPGTCLDIAQYLLHRKRYNKCY